MNVTHLLVQQSLRHGRQRSLLYRAMRSLMIAGLMSSTNGWMSATATAAIPQCGEPPTSQMVEPAVQVWQDCETGSWNLMVAGIGDSQQRVYIGSIRGVQPATNVSSTRQHSLLEPDDILNASATSKIEFALRVAKHGKDAFSFTFPVGTSICVDVTDPTGLVLVGPNRVPVTAPVDLRTLGSCGHLYLEDADLTDSVAAVTDSDLGEQPFPRISTGPAKPPVSAEQFSKYGMIAVRPNQLEWLSDVQAISPETRGLREHSAFAYQGFLGKPCSQADGMPFAWTGPVTEGCDVYAGHWLYAPGSTLVNPITADAITLRVADATRFNAGRYVVIYDGGPGAFVNAEHAQVTAVDRATNTLTLASRGFKSARKAHFGSVIVAEHVVGNGTGQIDGLWAYNQSTACPRDGRGRQLNAVMAEWLAMNYQKDGRGAISRARLDGILFDTDFAFLGQSGQRSSDVNNDLLVDDGIAPNGENLWGAGLETFYDLLREQVPNAVLIGGVSESRGYASLNGTQLEGWPRTFPFMSATPDYPEIDGRLSVYSIQMHHGRVGPRLSVAENKMPTKVYPSEADPNPAGNSGFRFGFGLMLLDDGYYGQANWHVSDPWWDEYAVDVIPGSASFGQAIASNPQNESAIRRHRGWMGFPLGPRYRVYDPAVFAPERNLSVNGDFDSNLTGWSGTNVTLTQDTASGSPLDGSGAMRISEPLTAAPKLPDAFAVGPKISLVGEVQYTLVFGVRSSSIRTIRVGVAEQTENLSVPDTWSRQVFTFTAGRTGNFPIRFNVGQERSEVWIDSVYLFEGNADVFRRDFDHAVVIVNATPSSQVVDLGGTLQRIQGTGQDPINNGAAVQQVTLAPYDSTVLVRP